jgi:hypothetical protein
MDVNVEVLEMTQISISAGEHVMRMIGNVNLKGASLYVDFGQVFLDLRECVPVS